MDEYLLQELGLSDPAAPQQQDQTSYLDTQGYQPPTQADFTDEDVLAAVIPGYTAEEPQVPTPAAPSPEPTTPSPDAPASLAALGEGMASGSVSGGGSGFSKDKYASIQKGPSRDLAKANDATIAQQQAQGAQMAGAFAQSSQLAYDAEDAKTKAQIQYDTELAGQNAWMADRQREFATKEAEAHAQAQSQAATAKTNYVAALNDFRASGVNPAQLWGSMNGAEKVGTLAAVFMHDYLAAKGKGIKTSTMDTINKSIDRNINAQLEGIRVKGEVAQGFKQLWDMQRAESASDAEARSRVKGFMLDSFKLQVEQHMAGFNSGLTAAKGEAAKAKISAEQAKNLFDVYKQVDENTRVLLQQNLSKFATDLSNSQAKNELGLKWAREKREAEEAKRKQAAEQGPKRGNFIVNPETNQAQWQFRDGTTPAKMEQLKDRAAALEDVNRNVTRLRELARSIDSEIDGIPRRMTTEEQRQYAAIQMQLAKSSLAARGERATDKDVEQELLSFPRDTKLTNGGVDKILAYTQENTIRTTQSALRQYADDVSGGFMGPDGQILAASLVDAKRSADGSGSELSPDQKDMAKAGQLVAGPASLESAPKTPEGDPAHVRAQREQFKTTYPEQFQALATGIRESNGGNDATANVEYGIARLAFAAEKGHKESKDRLEFLAKEYRSGAIGSETDYIGALAAMQLDNLSGAKRPDAPVTSTLNPDDPRTAEDFMQALEGR